MDLENIVVTEVMDAHTVHSVAGKSFKVRMRECYGISFCTSGMITYIQEGVEYVSDNTSVIILPKGGNYDLRRDKTGDFPVIDFECATFLCDTVTVIEGTSNEMLMRDYEKIQQLMLLKNERNKIMSVFYDLLSKISRHAMPRELSTALKYIEKNCFSPRITNADIAKECHISEVYFRKLFLKHLGISPGQYIIGIKIEHAKQLLSRGELKIKAISEACGFANPYHFSRLFRERVGVTPTEYRRDNTINII